MQHRAPRDGKTIIYAKVVGDKGTCKRFSEVRTPSMIIKRASVRVTIIFITVRHYNRNQERVVTTDPLKIYNIKANGMKLRAHSRASM